MASATLTLHDHAEADIVYSLVSQHAKGAQFKLVTRALALPLSLDFNYQVGEPGSKGNDRCIVTLRDTVQNGTTGVVSTGSVKVEISIPRDSAWVSPYTENLLSSLVQLLTSGNREKIADAIVP